MPDEKYGEGEVELRDYLNVVIKRKKIILSIFFISIITIAVVSFLMPKVYLSTAIIQNGFVNEPLLTKSETEEMIKFYYFLDPIVKELKLKINVEETRGAIKIEAIKDTDFFRFRVEYKDKDTSLKLCQLIVKAFLLESRSIYQQRINLINQRLAKLDEQIESLQSDIKHTQGLIQNLSAPKKIDQTKETTGVILLENALPNYYTNLASLFQQKDGLQLTLVKSKEFKLIEIVEPEYPVKRYKKINIVISIIVSLMFSVFLAFFIEYLNSYSLQKYQK